ncbi:MAG: DUF3419 family protein [Polyangiaceae bacterium]
MAFESLPAPAQDEPRLYFAQVREDSRVEVLLAAEANAKRVACVASGGCTALSLLRDGVEHVDAIDSNPAQCALVELRKAAVRALDQRDYVDFVQGTSNAPVTYQRMRSGLPAWARSFWDARPRAIERGVNRAGVTEAFYRFVSGNLLGSVLGAETWRALLDSDSVEQQCALYERFCKTPEFVSGLRVVLSRSSHLAFYPAFMFRNVSEHHFGDFFAQQFERELCTRPLRGNYFLSQLLFEDYRWDHGEGCPPYLVPARYAEVRRNIERLEVHQASLQEHLSRAWAGFDAIFLSNVFDWASAEQREDIARAALAACSPSGTIAWRQLLADVPLPSAFQTGLEFDAERSKRMHALDRSLSYRNFTLGRPRGSVA